MMKSLKLFFLVFCVVSSIQTLKAQNVPVTYLQPKSILAGEFEAFVFGQSWTTKVGGLMNHINHGTHYGDGNDLTLYTYDERDIVLSPGGAAKIVLNPWTSGQTTIGTLNPETGAALTVKGKVACREVKVTASAGADFVFDEKYDLPKLTEVERFVKTNKHLPEVPTACEMEDEGYDMGEFQVKLLQKIEELTLYTIEQQKRIENQNKRMEELERIVDEK